MALAAGTRLRQYEILGPLGAGGMGEPSPQFAADVVLNWALELPAR